jgi:enoyl-CoA hydratase/carnithine racemase
VADEVVVEKDGGRARIALNRPARLNALDLALVVALEEAARAVAADPDVAVVLVEGRGRSFCSGLDLDMFAAEGMSLGFYRAQERALRLLETMDKTVIAVIHGHCVGGGVQIAAACDIRVASTDATLALPAVDEGLFPGMAPFRLPRLVGKGRAASLILTGRPVGAEEAERIGLANEVVPEGRALERAQALAREIAALPQGAIRSDKESVLRGVGRTLEERLRIEAELCMSMFMRRDPHTIGAAAFKAGNLAPEWPNHGL